MILSNDQARELICTLLPEVQMHSRFLYPGLSQFDRSYIPARCVFDAIRNSTEIPITEEEFNRIADSCGGKDVTPE